MSITLQHLNKHFGHFQALNNINLNVPTGKLTSLLGPSGCGKTTLLRIIAGLEHADSGTILFDGQDVTTKHVRERKVGFVFQHYALFRHMNVFDNIAFGLSVLPKAERPGKEQIRAKVEELLSLVQLSHLAKSYPHQLSGGMSQRVMIAMALACEPKLLIADEPTTALDVTVQAQIMDLLHRLQREKEMAMVLITHDLGLVAENARDVAVMYAGQVVETSTVPVIFQTPAHPYTEALLQAIPELALGQSRLHSLPGVVPGQYDRPAGCLLAPRCPYKEAACDAPPPWQPSAHGHVRCIHSTLRAHPISGAPA